jgi:uncharacterized membrane protein
MDRRTACGRAPPRHRITSVPRRNGMVTFLQVSTVFFQMSFAAATFFLWDGGQILALLDTLFCVMAPFADLFWFKQYETSSELT